MFRGKKAQLAFIIVLIVTITIGLILFSSSNKLEAHAIIGLHQTKIMKAYAEGEAAREYVETSARLIVYDTFQSKNCPADINTNNFYGNMEKYLNIYVSPNDNFTTVFPVYIYEVETLRDGVQVTGKPVEKIKISSDLYGFEYKVNGYFDEKITCEEFGNYQVKPSFAR